MSKKSTYVRTDLAKLWRTNTVTIMAMLSITHEELAKRIGITRQSVTTMLTTKNFHLTGMQLIATTEAIHELIIERRNLPTNTSIQGKLIDLAAELNREVTRERLEGGL